MSIKTSDMKWISVVDLLPVDGEEVLLFHGGEYYFILMGKYLSKEDVFEDTASQDEENGYYRYEVGREITHWMPLPGSPD